jgi:hypothetical protein
VRRLLLALGGAVLLTAYLMVLNVMAQHDTRPRDLPLAVVGRGEAATKAITMLRERSPGAFSLRRADDAAAARRLIRHREVYAALVPDATPKGPVLITAAAASQGVQQRLQQQFQMQALQQGKELQLEDIVPLPKGDRRGTTSFVLVLAWIFGAFGASTLLFMLGRELSAPLRLALSLAYALVLAVAGWFVADVVVGALPGGFAQTVAVGTLLVFAVMACAAALQALLGLAGTVVAALTIVILGNVASGAANVPEFLPDFYAAVGRLLPPGAANEAYKDALFFDWRGSGWPMVTLGLYAAAGTIASVALWRLRPPGTASGRAEVRRTG